MAFDFKDLRPQALLRFSGENTTCCKTQLFPLKEEVGDVVTTFIKNKLLTKRLQFIVSFEYRL